MLMTRSKIYSKKDDLYRKPVYQLGCEAQAQFVSELVYLPVC